MDKIITFESLHEAGSKKYGSLWLRANQAVVDLAMYYDLDHIKHKQALSHIVKWVLDSANPTLSYSPSNPG